MRRIDSKLAYGRPSGRRSLRAVAAIACLLAWQTVAVVPPPARAADAGADLSLHAGSDQDVVAVGEQFTVILELTNDGPDEATGVVVAVRLPADWIFVGATPAADYDAATGTWSIGGLATGETKVLQIVATMNGQGVQFMDADVTASDVEDPDSTPGNCCSGEDDEAFVGVNGSLRADLSLSMAVDDPAPGVGTNVAFTLTLGNAGPSNVSGVGVKDVLPSNMTFVSATPPDYDPVTHIWNVPPLASDDSTSIDIVARVNDASTVTNYAEIYISSFIDPDSIRGNNSTNEDDDDSVTVTGQDVSADLSLHAGATPSVNVTIGGPAGMQVVVTNDGPDTATNVIVGDDLASLPGFAFVSADSQESGADYDFATGTWDVGTLASGATEMLEVFLTVTAAGESTARVEIVHSSTADPDSTPGNLESTGGGEDDGAQVSFLARGTSSDLSLDMSVDNASPTIGSDVTFTVTVTNDGPYQVHGVSVIDPLPAGLTFVSADPGLNLDYDSTTGVWSGFGLGSGDSLVLQIVATVVGSLPVTNYAEIATADLLDPDSTPGNSSTTEDDDSAVTISPTDDDLPTLSLDDAAPVAEGDSGTTPMRFAVRLSSVQATPVTVEYLATSDSATPGVDYVLGSAFGTLTFAPGEDTKIIEVAVIGDTIYEPDEFLSLGLRFPTGATIADSFGESRILNDDPAPARTLSIGDATAVVEGDAGTTDMVFTVTASSPSTGNVSFSFSTVSFLGTATAGVDHVIVGHTVTIAAGQTSTTVVVPIIGDTVDEPDETVTVQIHFPSDATLADDRGTGTIIDDDGVQQVLSIGDVTIAEGDAGTSDAVFTVSLSGATTDTVIVDYATGGGTATPGVDYTPRSGTLTFAAGDLAKEIRVPVIGDTMHEPDQTFLVTLSNPVNATIADDTAPVTIQDDDAPSAPTLSLDDAAPVAEGDSGTTPMRFAVRLSSVQATPVTVEYLATSDSATPGVDYVLGSAFGTLTFAPGEDTKIIEVAVIGDTIYEPDEFLSLGLRFPTGATIADSFGESRILNDDPAPARTLSIGDATAVVEGDAGTTDMVFTVTASSPSTGNVSFSFSTVSFLGTATAGVDHVIVGHTVTIAAGQTSTTVVVPIIGDTVDEPDETVTVQIHFPSDATLADDRGTGTIIDDDGVQQVLSIGDVTIAEGDAGTSDAVFTVSLSGATTDTVIVDYATGGGTATPGVDYTPRSGTLTFAAGDLAKEIRVPVIGDTMHEPDQTFLVTLSNPVNATIADDTATVTIQDDDAPSAPTLSLDDAAPVAEGDSGTTPMRFAVRLSSVQATPVTVEYLATSDSATPGVDYVLGSAFGTLTFAPGEDTKIIEVAVIGDTIYEPDEFLSLGLRFPTGATIADSFGESRILNDDPAPARTLSIGDATAVVEGDAGTTDMVFTVTASSPSTGNVSFSFSTVSFLGTATAGVDHVIVGHTVTIAAGQTSTTVVVPIIGDTVDEPDETVTVQIHFPSDATIADDRGTGTIIDDDPLPSLSIDDVSVTEGNAGTKNAVFTVSLSNGSSQPITVDYATAAGTATAGVDYTATSGTLTFMPGQVGQDRQRSCGWRHGVRARRDIHRPPSPTRSMATLADAQGQGTIVNDDLPTISIADASVIEGNAGTTDLTFTVSVSHPSASQISIGFATLAGSATGGVDFAMASGTVSFAPGDTTASVTIKVAGDVLDEINETLAVILSNPTNATIADGSATGTILDDDPLPSLSIDDVSVTEGDTGTTDAVFTVLLSTPSGRAVSVTYRTEDDTAKAGEDYQAKTGSVTIPAGDTKGAIVVKVNGDLDEEPDETFTRPARGSGRGGPERRPRGNGHDRQRRRAPDHQHRRHRRHRRQRRHYAGDVHRVAVEAQRERDLGRLHDGRRERDRGRGLRVCDRHPEVRARRHHDHGHH